LAGWTNEVQWPDDRSDRSKHRTVKCEVEQTVISLLEAGPRRTVILLRRLVLKSDRHTRPVWIGTDEREERRAAVACVNLEIRDQPRREIELSRRDETRHFIDTRLLKPHLEELWCSQHCVIASKPTLKGNLKIRDVVLRRRKADADVATEVTIDHRQPAKKPVATTTELNALRVATIDRTNAVAEVTGSFVEPQNLFEIRRQTKCNRRFTFGRSQCFPPRRHRLAWPEFRKG